MTDKDIAKLIGEPSERGTIALANLIRIREQFIKWVINNPTKIFKDKNNE